MSQTATVSLSYETVDDAARVERSLSPEVGDIDGDRSSAFLTRDGATVSITVEATDLVALRAGLNTWLTLASVAERAGAVAGRAGRP